MNDTQKYNRSATSNFENIPEEIRSGNVWVNWLMDSRNGKPTKIPINPNTGKKSAVNRPQEWGSFITAVQRTNDHSVLRGIGRMLSADENLVGLDLDDCVAPDGTIDPEALEVVKLFNSYAEISQSGTGLRIITKGKVPQGDYYKKNPHNKFECYSHNRFLVMTGDCLDFVSQNVEYRQAELEEFHAKWMKKESKTKPKTGSTENSDSKSSHQYENHDFGILPTVEDVVAEASFNSKFAALYSGDQSGYSSQSEADQALCNLLAFWCCDSFALIDACFIKSGLYRDKWDREDYKESTIENALSLVDERYDWGLYSDDLVDSIPSIDEQLKDMGFETNESTNCEDDEPVSEKPKTVFKMSQFGQIAKPHWQIKNNIVCNSHVAIYGPPGSGKSFLALDYALCVATGKPYQNIWDTKQGKVIYIYSESFSGVPQRVQAWWNHHPQLNPADYDNDIVFCSESFNFLEKTSVERMLQINVAELQDKPSLIVIDTLSRNFGGLGESDEKAMPQYVENVKRLMNYTQGTVITVHHSGKDVERGLRGHSSLEAGVDTIFQVKSSPSKNHCYISNEKQKDKPAWTEKITLEKVNFKLDELDEDGEPLSSCVWVLQEVWKTRRMSLKRDVRELLEAIESKWIGVEFENKEALKLSDASARSAQRHLKMLQDKGFLLTTEYGKSRLNPESSKGLSLC